MLELQSLQARAVSTAIYWVENWRHLLWSAWITWRGQVMVWMDGWDSPSPQLITLRSLAMVWGESWDSRSLQLKFLSITLGRQRYEYKAEPACLELPLNDYVRRLVMETRKTVKSYGYVMLALKLGCDSQGLRTMLLNNIEKLRRWWTGAGSHYGFMQRPV